jgi:hypothetical protein
MIGKSLLACQGNIGSDRGLTVRRWLALAYDPLAGKASLAPFLVTICFPVGTAALSYSLAA